MTAPALELSIKKWRAIVKGTGVDNGQYNCALCAEYIDNECSGCPVAKATGQIYCGGSPYKQLWVANSKFSPTKDGRVAYNKIGKQAAKDELAFLIGLRRFYKKARKT